MTAARGRGAGGPYLLAVDAGTGSCRALLFTEAGEQVAVSLREWSHREPPGVPGGQDFDVEANWRAITACIRDVLQLGGRHRRRGRGGRGDQHARGHRALRRARRRDLGLPERGQPRRRGRPPS